jgi:hypothetical protein
MMRVTLLLLAITAGVARADNGFDAAVDEAASHTRAALAYLREERPGRALAEIERMRESFALLAERYGKDRPTEHRDNPDYVTALVDIPLRMITAHMMVNFGRPVIAYNSLVAVCRSLGALRGTSEPDCPGPIEPPSADPQPEQK